MNRSNLVSSNRVMAVILLAGATLALAGCPESNTSQQGSSSASAQSAGSDKPAESKAPTGK